MAKVPDAAALGAQLGAAKATWDDVVAHLERVRGSAALEWKHYGARLGWQLKVTRGRKALLYLIPHEGRFVVATALGPAELALLHASGLPAELIRDIEAGRALPEGKAARVEVRNGCDAALAKRLLAWRMAPR